MHFSVLSITFSMIAQVLKYFVLESHTITQNHTKSLERPIFRPNEKNIPRIPGISRRKKIPFPEIPVEAYSLSVNFMSRFNSEARNIVCLYVVQ